MKIYYKRYLPHLVPPGGIFFITAVLKNSLPVNVIKTLKEERKTLIEQLNEARYDLLSETAYQEKLIEMYKRQFIKIDRLLDASKEGKHYLKDHQAAQILANKFHQYNGNYYRLEAFVIMSNHFHLLIDTSIQLDRLSVGIEPNDDNYTPLSKIMNLIKGGSAYSINQSLKRTGVFWQHESYDHLVRNEKEYFNIHRYILNNPVKAGLVQNWKEYEFTYSREGLG